MRKLEVVGKKRGAVDGSWQDLVLFIWAKGEKLPDSTKQAMEQACSSRSACPLSTPHAQGHTLLCSLIALVSKTLVIAMLSFTGRAIQPLNVACLLAMLRVPFPPNQLITDSLIARLPSTHCSLFAPPAPIKSAAESSKSTQPNAWRLLSQVSSVRASSSAPAMLSECHSSLPFF